MSVSQCSQRRLFSPPLSPRHYCRPATIVAPPAAARCLHPHRPASSDARPVPATIPLSHALSGITPSPAGGDPRDSTHATGYNGHHRNGSVSLQEQPSGVGSNDDGLERGISLGLTFSANLVPPAMPAVQAMPATTSPLSPSLGLDTTALASEPMPQSGHQPWPQPFAYHAGPSHASPPLLGDAGAVEVAPGMRLLAVEAHVRRGSVCMACVVDRGSHGVFLTTFDAWQGKVQCTGVVRLDPHLPKQPGTRGDSAVGRIASPRVAASPVQPAVADAAAALGDAPTQQASTDPVLSVALVSADPVSGEPVTALPVSAQRDAQPPRSPAPSRGPARTSFSAAPAALGAPGAPRSKPSLEHWLDIGASPGTPDGARARTPSLSRPATPTIDTPVLHLPPTPDPAWAPGASDLFPNGPGAVTGLDSRELVGTVTGAAHTQTPASTLPRASDPSLRLRASLTFLDGLVVLVMSQPGNAPGLVMVSVLGCLPGTSHGQPGPTLSPTNPNGLEFPNAKSTLLSALLHSSSYSLVPRSCSTTVWRPPSSSAPRSQRSYPSPAHQFLNQA